MNPSKTTDADSPDKGPGWNGPTLDHPSLLYHASSDANRASILELGLDARFSDAAQTGGADYLGGGGLFFSSKPSHSNSDVWAVDVTGITLERDQATEHEHLGEEWWVSYETDNIAPSRLTLLPKSSQNHIPNPETA
jgi:hypothetical protein